MTPAPVPFSITPWAELERFYEDLVDEGMENIEPLLAIVRSVVAEGASASLSAHTSMHDLVVTTTPLSTTPDTLRISASDDRQIRIDHRKPTGPGDSIERLGSDALPLFWRFTIEKWGIHPAREDR
jgi:hypothetical protein